MSEHEQDDAKLAAEWDDWLRDGDEDGEPESESRKLSEAIVRGMRMRQAPPPDVQEARARDMKIRAYLSDLAHGDTLHYEGEVWTVVCRAGHVLSSSGDKTGPKSIERSRFRDALKRPMRLRTFRNQHEVDELVSCLHEGAPWCAEMSQMLYDDLSHAVAIGRPWLSLKPTILVGPPGCGKTSYLQRFAEFMELPTARIDCTNATAAFQISGVEYSWNAAEAGRVAKTIADHQTPNPIIIIDEVDKANLSPNGGGVAAALMPMIEPSTSRTWVCPYSEMQLDLSHASFLMTANSLDGIPGPLRDRSRIVMMRPASRSEISRFITLRLEGDCEPEIVREAVRRVMEVGGSLRAANRLCDALLRVRARLDARGPLN